MQRILSAISFIILYFSFFISPGQNISDLETFEKAMKPGTVLTYDVTMGERKYQLIATLKKLGDEIIYGWEATDPVNKKGNVTMSASAVSKADALFIDFSGGEAKLDKETAMFISKKMFNDVAATAQASLKLSGASDTVTLLSNTISEFNFNLNDNLVAVPGWELQGGSEIKFTVGVLESVKFPLIVRMDLGWLMQLAEIKTP